MIIYWSWAARSYCEQDMFLGAYLTKHLFLVWYEKDLLEIGLISYIVIQFVSNYMILSDDKLTLL